MEEKEILGCQSEALAINLLLEQALAKSGGNLVEENLISLLREFNSNEISGVLRHKIRRLQERLDAGEDTPQIRMMLRIILRSKWKQLENQQGSQAGTPASSDDEDEEEYEVFPEDEFSIKDTEEEDDDHDDVSFTKDKEEDENGHGDDSSITNLRQSFSALTTTPPTSDSEDDEQVHPVAFINEVTEHHPNSHFTFEQIRKPVLFSTINKIKIIKVRRNMPDVAKTTKPLKKNRKADQVTVPDDKAVKTTVKK